MAIKLKKFDAASYLEDEEMVIAFMDEALSTEDPAFIADALGVVARSKGMMKIAKKTALSRESLYKALSPDGNPQLGTVIRVIQALGLKLSVSRAKPKLLQAKRLIHRPMAPSAVKPTRAAKKKA